MTPRILDRYLLKDAGFYPVVTLTGPRQSGKTTLIRSAFPDHTYVSMEQTENRQFALDDPHGFLGRFKGPVIFDEAQRAPDLFSYIQTSVDEVDDPGRFILTGSQNFLLMESISQTLAGRCGILHLMPFSRAELEEQAQVEPTDSASLFTNESSRLDLWQTMFHGYYPRIHEKSIPPEIWLADYVQTYMQRDVRSLVNIGDLERFERFVMLVAGRTGQLLNYSGLANDCGISVDTARRWISVLKTSFLVFLLTPHYQNFNKRVIKSPKIYFYDTGLVCHLLGIRNPEQLHMHPLRGPLFENLIIAEVAKTYLHHRRQPPIHFWRDQTGHEIDLIIEEGTQLFPVEIKSGQTIASNMFDTLHWWCQQAGQPLSTATLIYGGNHFHTQNQIAVRPWFSV